MRKKGFRSMGEVPGQQSDSRWDEMLPLLSRPSIGKPVQIRLVGGFATIVTHYVKFVPKGSNDLKGFYTLCPNWDIAEATSVDNGCPICANFHKYIDVRNDFEWLRMPQSFRYLAHAFHITNIKKNADEQWGLVNMNVLEWKELKGIAEAIGSSVDDDKRGVVLTWLAQKSSNPYMSGVEYKFVSTGKRLPVKYIENKDAYVCKLGGKVHKGVLVDLLDSIETIDSDVLEQKLHSLGCYAALAKATGAPVSVSVSGTSSDDIEFDTDNDDDLDDISFDDEDTVDEEKTNTKKNSSRKRGNKSNKSNKGNKKKAKNKNDDDDLSFDDDDDDLSFDDDDDDSSDSSDDLDDFSFDDDDDLTFD